MNLFLFLWLGYLIDFSCADFRQDQLEVTGKIIGINDNYVTLLTPDKQRSFVPAKSVSDIDKKSTKEVTIYISPERYQEMVSKSLYKSESAHPQIRIRKK